MAPWCSNEGRSSNDSATSNAQAVEPLVNPFAPTPASDAKKKRSSRKRQSFPPAWSAGLGGAPLSKYLSDFSELELIGSGSFSKVFKCMKKIDGWVYAVKKSKRHFRGRADTCVQLSVGSEQFLVVVAHVRALLPQRTSAPRSPSAGCAQLEPARRAVL